MARRVKVAAIQQGPVPDNDIPGQVERLVGLLGEAASGGVQLATFCEVSLGPFFPNRLTRDFKRYFVSLDDPVVEPVLAAARRHQMVVVFPFAENGGSGYYNSAAVIGSDGNPLGRYRKVHIPAVLPSDLPGGTGSYEKFYFAPGDLGFPVFATPYGKLGVQICYDRKFPEGSRALALQGTEMIFIPIAASTYGERKERGDTWDLPLRARAYENGVFVIAANRVGDEQGRVSMGRSMIISPAGEVLAEGSRDREEVISADIDLEDVEKAQTGLPWWRDRRPSEYRSLVSV